MQEIDVVAHIVATLDAMGIAYAVTCSFASIAYGEMRATNDIDLIAHPPLLRCDLARSIAAAYSRTESYVRPVFRASSGNRSGVDRKERFPGSGQQRVTQSHAGCLAG